MDFLEFYKHKELLVLEQNDATNKHLTHLDELILVHGKEGANKTIDFISQLFDLLKGHSKASINATVKWDGAPAVVIGRDPVGKFFVGSKSVFAKDAKLNYSVNDILKNHAEAPGLADKLIKVFNAFKNADVDGVYQGDLLFWKGSIDKNLSFDGEKYIGFRPNTILYALPASSEEAKKILQVVNANGVGVVFHTKYTVSYDENKIVRFGNTQFGIGVEHINAPNAYVLDAKFDNQSGTVTLTADESTFIKREIDFLAHLVRAINFKNIELDNKTLSNINIFINSLIRQGSFIENIEEVYDSYKEWLSVRWDKDIEKRTRKEAKIQQKNTSLQNTENARADILKVFQFIKNTKLVKDIFIQKYNNILKGASIGTYLIQPNGDIKVTNPEGYVAFDQDQNGVKFVDRLEFSRANFTIPKDWVKTEEPLESPPQEIAAESFSFRNFFKEQTEGNDITVIWPGGFKPPHKGHYEALKLSIQKTGATQAIIFIGKKMREGVSITPEQSKAIWDIYLKHLNIEGEAVIPNAPNPVTPVYEYVDNHLTDKIIVGVGDKDGDELRYSGFKKDPKYKNVSIEKIAIQGGGISGTLTREKLASGDIMDALNYMLPDEVKNNKQDLLAIKQILIA